MSQEFIEKLTLIVEANLSDENFGPEQLADKLSISHSTLHRRLKRISGKTISQFIRDIRLEKARTLLLSEESTISEIAYNVGFGSVTYFNRCFHEHFGCAPGEYKKIKVEKEKIISDENLKTGLRKRWILSLTSLLIIVAVFFLLNHKYSFFNDKPVVDLSIAVLPVQYLGLPEYEYQAIGLGEEIKNQLSNIGDLRVVDVMAVKEFISDKSEKEIGKELKVGALLKITSQKENDENTLFVQLLNANDGTILFSEKYLIEGQFAAQNNIALTVAKKLRAEITPEEKDRIEKVPSINPDANDFYQRGRGKHMEYWLDNSNLEALQKAEDYYQKALKLDSTFALAYAGLARIAYDKTRWSDIFNENYLDTVLTLANKALSLDNTLSEAYTLLGDCYTMQKAVNAVEEYQNALKYDPNNWQAYYGLATYYIVKDSKKTIQYSLEAAKRHRGPEYGIMLNGLAFEFTIHGLFEEATNFNRRKLEWDNDSISYYTRLAAIEQYHEHFDKAIEYALKGYAIDSNAFAINGILGFNYVLLHDYKNALSHYEKASEISNTINYKGLGEFHRIGYVYLVNGDTIKAKELFNRQIEASTKLLKSSHDQGAFYDLAATYSILNQKDKAFENLIAFLNSDEIPWFFYVLIKNDPLFQNIRKEAEFQQILVKVKDKATRTRDSLKTWLEQQENS